MARAVVSPKSVAQGHGRRQALAMAMLVNVVWLGGSVAGWFPIPTLELRTLRRNLFT